MSSKSELLRHKSRLKHQAPKLMRLEPRVMFDGAMVDTLVGQTNETEVDLYIAPPATEETAADSASVSVLFAISTPLDTQTHEAMQQAEAAITAFMAGTDAKALFSLFSGQQHTPDDAWLAVAEALRQQILKGEFSVLTRVVGADVLGTTYAAFAASGPNGEPTIFINEDWLSTIEDPAFITRILVEEIGHAIDQALNGDQDTQGDEGEAFAVTVLNLPVNFIDEARIAIQNDQRTIFLEGEAFVVETANFGFVNAYEMVYDLNNNNQMDNTERWAEKEQNTHFFNTLSLGQAIIDDNTNSQYFSGNDVSAIGIKIGEETLYGWISRPIKANGIVRGFYFWTDKDFIDLATAQADGNTDGDRNVADNRGFLLVVDQSWFDQQIASTSRALTINNDKDGNLGNIAVAAVGSSSDKVDSSINALIVPNGAPTPTPDLLIGPAGTLITGDVLTNDTDPDNDLLRVTQFVVGGQTYLIPAGATPAMPTEVTATIVGVGNLTIRSDGAVIFAPESGYSGNVPSVTYSVTDGSLSASTVLSILVNPINDPPISSNDTLVIDSGSPVLLSLNDFGAYSDPNNDPLAWIRITSLPDVGSLQYFNGTTWIAVTQNQDISAAHINAGRLRYTPEGTTDVNIEFAVSDGKHFSESNYTLAIIVNEAPPVAYDINAPAAIEGVDGEKGTPATGSLLPPGSMLTLSFIGNTPVAASGETEIFGLYGTLFVRADGYYRYEANNDSLIVDALNVSSTALSESFTYTLASTTGFTASAKLNVSIMGANDSPVARDDVNTITEALIKTDGHYGQVSSSSQSNVLFNDHDVDNGLATLQVYIEDAQPIIIDGEGVNSFNATATSPVDNSTVRYTLTNAGPNLNSLTANTPVYIVDNGVEKPALDRNGVQLTASPAGPSNNRFLSLSDPIAVLSYPSDTIYKVGNVTFGITGVTYSAQSSSQITLTSVPPGTIQQGYLVSGTGIPQGTYVGTITGDVITLVDANDQQVQVQITNAELTFTNPNAQPAQTLTPVQGEKLILGQYGYLSLKSDGSYIYTLTKNTLNAGQNFVEEFEYQVIDAQSAISNKAILRIYIDGTSGVTAPVDGDEILTTNEDTALTGHLFGHEDTANRVETFRWLTSVGELQTYTVANGSSVTVSNVFGELVVHSNGQFNFTPANNYNGSVPIITYTSSTNGGNERATSTLMITVTPVNDAPESTDDSITVAINTPTLLTLNDFGQYSDVDGDPLHSIKITTLPLDGYGLLQKLDNGQWIAVQVEDVFTVTQIANGLLRYTTALDAAAGNDYSRIGFKVNDGSLDSESAYTLKVNVIAAPPQIIVGQAPVNSVPGAQTIPEFAPLTFSEALSVSVADSDNDLASVTLSVAKGILNITALDNHAGSATGVGSNLLVLTGTQEQINNMLMSLVYIPNAGSNGEDTLRIHSVDATNRSAIDFVTLNVTADDRELTVTGTEVNEASPYLMFKVQGEAGQKVTLALVNTGAGAGHATIGADVLPALEYLNGVIWTSYINSEPVILPEGGALQVRVAVLQDSLNEGVETLKLVASNTAGTGFEGIGSIRDDAQGAVYLASNTTFTANTSSDSGYPAYLDDDRPISVNNIAVNEASPYAVFTVSGLNGQIVRLQLQPGTAHTATESPALNGTEDFGPALEVNYGNGWVAYTPNSDITLTSSTLLVRTSIVNDELFEGQEGFSLAVTPVSQGNRVFGVASIYDDGTGDIFLGSNITGIPNVAADTGYPVLDDDRVISITSPLVNEASDWAVFTLTGNAGQTVVLEVINSSQNGTEQGKANLPANTAIQIYAGVDASAQPIWEDYEPNAALPTFNDGGKIFVRVSILQEQDDRFEGAETFQLKATLAQQSITITNQGEVTVINSLHPSLTASGTATIYDNGTGVIFTNHISQDGPVSIDVGLDDDTPGLTLSKTLLTTREEGSSDSFSVVLKSQPSSSVTITIGGLDASEGNLSSSLLIFTPENWNQAQTITVTGVDDDLLDGDQTYSLLLTASSADSHYQGKTSVVKVTNLDNEVAVPPRPQPIPEPITPPPTTTAPAPITQVTLPSDPAPVLSSPLNSFQPLVDNSSGSAPWEQFFSLFESNQSFASESHQLTTERNIPDVQLGLNGEVRFTIPADTFAHTDAQALVVLTATMVDGTPLPSWLRFDPVSGQLTGQTPAGYRGELQVRVVARDEAGRQAETLVRVNQGSNGAAEANPRTTLSNTRSAQDGLYSYNGPTTASSGFPVAVDTSGVRNGEHLLKVARAIPDQLFIPTGEGLLFVIPTDAFVHSDSSAQVELDATLVDGSKLPDWLEFDPEKGEFKGTPPEGFEGELLIKVIARDQDGRQAETQVRIRITAAGQVSVWMGRPGLSEQIQAQGVFAWKAERDQLIRDAMLAAQSNNAFAEEVAFMPGEFNELPVEPV